MNITDKKLNQILNLLNLIHEENTFFLAMIRECYIDEENKKAMLDYINTCNAKKQAILSGMYEDDIGMTN